MFVTDEVFQEDRSRLEILEFTNFQNMSVSEEVFQEDISRVEISNFSNIEDIFVDDVKQYKNFKTRPSILSDFCKKIITFECSLPIV